MFRPLTRARGAAALPPAACTAAASVQIPRNVVDFGIDQFAAVSRSGGFLVIKFVPELR